MAFLKIYYEAIDPYVNDVTKAFTGVEYEECIDKKEEFEYKLKSNLPCGCFNMFYREHVIEEYH